MAVSLKATIVISLIWHLLLPGLIEPTFKSSQQGMEATQIQFLGSLLSPQELVFEPGIKPSDNQRISLINFKISPIDKIKNSYGYFSALKIPQRPAFDIDYFSKKQKFIPRLIKDYVFLHKKKKESTLVFYPRLPYSFLIYFKDRQKAHIEFTFYISEEGRPAFINRKVSSGNLEVDLLASRYITRHLNIIKSQFPANTWQTVKIDLTRKDDQD